MQPAHERPAAEVRRLLTAFLRAPEDISTLSARDLDLGLRLARRVRLLGRVAERLHRTDALAALPPAAREQLESALVVVDARARGARWELDRLVRALGGGREMRLVALKGSAYLLAG